MTKTTKTISFTQEELQRYSRHFAVEKIGLTGQEKIKSTAVLLIGAGGIGSPAALYLNAAGIGTLGILDDDTVDLSNLQRQIIYTTADLGFLKAETAAVHLNHQNPHVQVIPHPIRLTESNAHAIFKNYDLVIDGSDNYPTRYLTNDVCAELKIPLISASIFQFSGQIGVFNFNPNTQSTPCYRCLYPSPPPPELIPNCAMAGVLGVVPGILATMAVGEALKIILELNKFQSQLILYDTLGPKLDTYPILSNPHCEICGQHKKFAELSRFNLNNQKQNSCQLNNSIKNPTEIQGIKQLSVQELLDWNKAKKSFHLLDVRENWERLINQINPSIHIPLGSLNPKNSLLDLDKTQPLIIYCKSGGRSQQAALYLSDLGFTEIYNLSGGITAWEKLI